MSPRPPISSRGNPSFPEDEYYSEVTQSCPQGREKHTGPSRVDLAILSANIEVIILSRAKGI